MTEYHSRKTTNQTLKEPNVSSNASHTVFCLLDLCRISLWKMTHCAPMLLSFCKKVGRADMERTDLIDGINTIFREVFDDDVLVVTPEMTAVDIKGWDSLSHIRLIVAHEIKFGVKFKTTELSDLKNVGNFIDLLKSKLV